MCAPQLPEEVTEVAVEVLEPCADRGPLCDRLLERTGSEATATTVAWLLETNESQYANRAVEYVPISYAMLAAGSDETRGEIADAVTKRVSTNVEGAAPSSEAPVARSAGQPSSRHLDRVQNEARQNPMRMPGSCRRAAAPRQSSTGSQ